MLKTKLKTPFRKKIIRAQKQIFLSPNFEIRVILTPSNAFSSPKKVRLHVYRQAQNFDIYASLFQVWYAVMILEKHAYKYYLFDPYFILLKNKIPNY